VSTSSSVSAPKFSDRYSGYASSMNSSESYAKTKNFDDDFSQDFPDYEESSSSGYKKGMRIRHPTFGLGSIFEVEGAGDNMKLSVLFTDQTIKKFVAKYARLEKL
jgi:DNA helicase-2/ATP-dependent DNA helicase PcrA